METRDFEMLKLRVVDGLSLEKIGEKYDLTRERVRQIILAAYGTLLTDDYRLQWMKREGIDDLGEPLLDLVLSAEQRERKALIRLLDGLRRNYDIRCPEDIIKIPQKDILRTKNFGATNFWYVKRALMNYGMPYDLDTKEVVEQKIAASAEKSCVGLRLRFRILRRDKFRCQYCGKSPKDDERVVLEVDHVRPLSKGGMWDDENLVTSCKNCNLGKGDIILQDGPADEEE
jgi:hypothetical protein